MGQVTSDRDLCQCAHKRENHGFGEPHSCREPGCDCRAFEPGCDCRAFEDRKVLSLACGACGGFLAREFDAGDAGHASPAACIAELREQIQAHQSEADLVRRELEARLARLGGQGHGAYEAALGRLEKGAQDEARHRLALGVEVLRRLEALEKEAKAERGARRALEARLEAQVADTGKTLETIRLRLVGFEGRFDALRRDLGELEGRHVDHLEGYHPRESTAGPDLGHARARLFALDGKAPHAENCGCRLCCGLRGEEFQACDRTLGHPPTEACARQRGHRGPHEFVAEELPEEHPGEKLSPPCVCGHGLVRHTATIGEIKGCVARGCSCRRFEAPCGCFEPETYGPDCEKHRQTALCCSAYSGQSFCGLTDGHEGDHVYERLG